MKEENVLYQIKDLNKMLLRIIINDTFFDDKKLEMLQVPTPTQMQIIGYILENKDKDIFQKDLENILDLSRATVSGVLQTMEKKALIKRVSNEFDTRTKKIILNEKAMIIFNKYKEKLEFLEKIIIKDISNEDLQVFCKTIKHMKSNIENISSKNI